VRTTTLILFWSMLFLSSCSHESRDQTDSSDQAAGSRYLVKRLGAVFGEDTQTLSCDFRIFNDADRPVRIVRINQSCSCTSVETDEKELQPCAATTLHLRANLRGRWGSQRFSCAVVPDEGTPWQCEALVNVLQRARIEPAFLHFGLVDLGAESRKHVALKFCTPRGETTPEFLSVSSTGKEVLVHPGDMVEEDTLDGMVLRNVVLEVTVVPQSASEVGRAELSILCRIQGAVRQIQLPIDWRVESVFGVSPARIFWRVDSSGHSQEQMIAIRRVDGRPLTIRAVRSHHPAISCVTGPTGDAVKLTLDPTKVPKMMWGGEVIVETDHPLHPTLTIPVAFFRRTDSR
jgi:hypothetical protein